MNDIVKYHNDMNKVNFGNFSTKELDLFFSICFKLKEIGTDEIKFFFNDIKFLIGEENNPKRVKFHIDNLNKKLAQLNYQFEISPNIFERFVLFTNFTSNYNDNSLIIKVNSKFGYLLNNLISNFTKFDLIEFVNLKSSYSKNMFKLLKQWESVKSREFKIDEFRNLLNIPIGFSMSKINERILEPIMTELPQYFFNLKLEKIKTGKKVTSLNFSWNSKEKSTIDIKDVEVVEIKISEQLNKAIEKAKQNRFIKNLLTLDNIEILTHMFQENDLIKGLIWAYKEVRQDINTLNYLIKTIRTGAEKKEIKIKVKKEKIQESLFDENPSIIEKIDITREEFNKKYKEYLVESGMPDSIFIKKGFELKYNILEVIKENIPDTKILTEKDIPEEQLLGKNGKKLSGAALKARINKILNKNDLI